MNKKLIKIIKIQIKFQKIMKSRYNRLMNLMTGRLKYRHASLKGKIIPKIRSLLLEKVKSVEVRNLEKVSFKIKRNNLDLETESTIIY